MATKTKKSTKASRSAAARKAAATRKRNAAKRSAAAKKAAATRRRNAKRTTRKTTAKRSTTKRSTKASRSAAAKKAAATRKRNAAKRSAAAKKAAATRRRKAKRTSRKASSTKRSTKASRSRAAKKAAATRKRNAAKRSRAAKKAAATRRRKGSRKAKRSTVKRSSKASRSAAARKGWRTRRRNGTAKRSSSKRRSIARRRRGKVMGVAQVRKAGKGAYGAAMSAPSVMMEAVVQSVPALALIGVYSGFIKPAVWGSDVLNLTGSTGRIAYVMSDVLKVGSLSGSMNLEADTIMAAETVLDAGTLLAAMEVLKRNKIIDAKAQKAGNYLVGLSYGLYTVTNLNVFGIGSRLTNFLMTGRFQESSPVVNNVVSNSPAGTMHGLAGAHNNMGMYHGTHTGMIAQNYAVGRKVFGTHNASNQLMTANTAASQMGTGRSGFFGTSGKSKRVNLF